MIFSPTLQLVLNYLSNQHSKPMNLSKENRKLGRVTQLLRKSGDWYGIDESLDVSLMEYNFVYKLASPGTYVFILRIGDNYQIGSGYKVELVEKCDLLDPSNECIPLPDHCNNVHNMAAMEDALLLEHTIHHGDFHVPSHYFDKPHSLDKLLEMLEDAVD